MSRKHIPLVIGLLMLLVTACLCPASAAPAATNTTTIRDVCELLKADDVGKAMGDKIVKPLKLSLAGGQAACSWETTDGTTGVILVVAQDENAVNTQMTIYANLDAAQKCAKPVQADPAAVKAALAEFEKLGLQGNARVLASLNWEAMLVKQKNCVDAYRFQTVPGLGDTAYAFKFGVGELEAVAAVYRNVLFHIGAFQNGMADKDALDIETKLLGGIIKMLEPK